ncbi:hypothetical protein DL98DRAFT_196315 [Cadophora sp. DSE1049]|nr:hypothetical protein DL98DRAFT_196315 [Cadophora sp. DSE1049]
MEGFLGSCCAVLCFVPGAGGRGVKRSVLAAKPAYPAMRPEAVSKLAPQFTFRALLSEGLLVEKQKRLLGIASQEELS